MKRRRRRIPWVVILAGAALVMARGAGAQLAPGPLSRAHADLEGVRNCTRCHALGTREVTANCLACHREIAAMRNGGPGLHREEGFAACSECHVEHQGRDFDLIHWPQGHDGFAHQATGFPLTGRHAVLQCRQCHRADHVQDAARWRGQGKDLERTWLGLSSACVACHDDVHRQQFGAVACSQCHATTAWRPAPGFDHANTDFPLDGRHARVDCDKCHVPELAAGGSPSFRRYADLPSDNCNACHQDPHAGALGADCRGCHATSGWHDVRGGEFDHDRTRYPLRGRHAKVACAGCHANERRKPAFAACIDCHRDAHDGAARGRSAWRACETCHTVDGYRPARFDLARHDATAFALRGAHRAVACDACHKRRSAAEPAPDLAPTHAACVDCHRDPHNGQTVRVQGARGCPTCHDETSWRRVAFDHLATGYPLEGGHTRPACAACHPVPAFPTPAAARACADCHADIHAGQFAAGGGTACDRCHGTQDWYAEKFDHDRDSRFPLRGGHQAVACTKCHLPHPSGRSLQFKPLATECASCHRVVPKEKS